MAISGFWSVAQTETQREGTAARFLKDAGYETYLPKIKIQKRLLPLFPSYLFVRIVDRWYPVNNTVGVINLLLAGDQPAKLKDEIVSNIRNKERGGIVRLPPKPGLKVGQHVRILRGSFENHVGVYDGMTGKERERVLLELLGRKVPVEFNKGDFAPLQDVARPT